MNEPKKIKCVVWDLDNTMWDGILAEGDDVKLKPGIEDVMKTLDKRGILHSIASKGNHEDALQKLRGFRIDEYFLYPEINWNPKSLSITEIQKNLNIGMNTLMFIDDNPFERDEVRSVHPEITCIEESQYLNLCSDPRLIPAFITEDSSRRRLMYLEDQNRKREQEIYKGPKKEFLASLNINLIISEAREEDLRRAEELTIRTNQLNATGKTYGYDELKNLMESENHKLLICEMDDRYGSYGKIGLVLIEILKEYFHIRLLLFSCRVLSYGVGTVLLSYIGHEANKMGKKIRADFKDSGRNRMMYVTFKFDGFKETMKHEDGAIVLERDTNSIQDYPQYINIRVK